MPGHERVYYSDGTVGQRFVGNSTPDESPRMDEQSSGVRAWDDSMDGAPASPEEMELMMQEMRMKSGQAYDQKEEQELPQKGS